MSRLLALAFLGAVALSANACEPAVVRLEFTERDVSDPEGYISVKSERDRQCILVSSPKHGIALQLPYAEDWRFASGPDALAEFEGRSLRFAGGSLSQGLDVAISVTPCSRVVDPEAYLRHEILERQLPRRGLESWRIKDAVILKHGDNAVLELAYHYGPYHFTEVRSIRQARNGDVVLLEVETLVDDEPTLSKLRPLMRDIAGKHFTLTR